MVEAGAPINRGLGIENGDYRVKKHEPIRYHARRGGDIELAALAKPLSSILVPYQGEKNAWIGSVGNTLEAAHNLACQKIGIPSHPNSTFMGYQHKKSSQTTDAKLLSTPCRNDKQLLAQQTPDNAVK